MAKSAPHMIGVYLFVSNLGATKDFYAALGLEIEHVSDTFARVTWSDNVILEFGTSELTSSYDPNFEAPGYLSKSTINFQVESEDEVDAKYEALKGLGYEGQLAPINAPWKARFAIVKDPDGNFIGLHSPRDRASERKIEQTVS